MRWVVVVCAALVTLLVRAGAAVSEQHQLSGGRSSLPDTSTTFSDRTSAAVTSEESSGLDPILTTSTPLQTSGLLHSAKVPSLHTPSTRLLQTWSAPAEAPPALLASTVPRGLLASQASPTTQASSPPYGASPVPQVKEKEKEVSEVPESFQSLQSVPPTPSVPQPSTASQPSSVLPALVRKQNVSEVLESLQQQTTGAVREPSVSQASITSQTSPVFQASEPKEEAPQVPELLQPLTTRTSQESPLSSTLQGISVSSAVTEREEIQEASRSRQPPTTRTFQEPSASTPSISQPFPVLQALVGRPTVSKASSASSASLETTVAPESSPTQELETPLNHRIEPSASLAAVKESEASLTSLTSAQTDGLINEFISVDDGQLASPESFKEYSDSLESLESQESNDLLTPLEASTVSGALEAAEASEENWMEEEDVDIPWPWMLFVLSGNTKVASRRQRDLGTYLRLNLAARLDADYNDVAINRILLTQDSILANISVEPSHLVGTGAVGLETLGQGNVTLLELSGHEFTVDRIIRVTELVDQRYVLPPHFAIIGYCFLSLRSINNTNSPPQPN